MLPMHITLNHYKRRDIQEEIIYNSKNKEVAARFNESFGNRPDTLNYPKDILELAKQGATSFHASEELWQNPLVLNPNLKKQELDDLRIGWDLVLDIDCPYWKYSKLIAHLIINALKKHGVTSISCKFSGNKGFHIGVPFEAFPVRIGEKETKLYFPDRARTIAKYLIDCIDNKDNGYSFTKKVRKDKSLMDLVKKTNKEIYNIKCVNCGGEAKIRKQVYGCFKCGNVKQVLKEGLIKCDVCSSIMERIEGGEGFTKPENIPVSKGKKGFCPKCGPTDIEDKFNISLILNIDAILISSRHLYRMPYSLHEKSGLVSLTIDPSKVLEFEKEYAKPDGIKISKFRFLDRENIQENNAKNLLDAAVHWFQTEIIAKEDAKNKLEGKLSEKKKRYEDIGEVPEHLFPPCIKAISAAQLKDGRKRALFILINFLTSCGWGYDKTEKYLREWNKKLEEPLREVSIVGQLRYHKSRNKKILPPNCNNQMYMVDIGVCKPDNLCSKIKNPVSYAIRKGFYSKKEKVKEKA